MTSPRHLVKTFLQGAVLCLAVIPALWGQAPSRTLFKDIPPNDPKREILQTVVSSPFYSMQGMFQSQEWTTGHYGGAWERARQYYPNHAYFIQPGTYFMTHGFSSDGKLFMEIHESAYLSLCAENRQTFTNRTIVAEYARMLGAAGGREAAAFREKMGRLESYFRDEASKDRLRKRLGDRLYERLLKELREENYHMFAGGLMHEGMHAKMDDDALVARIQTDYRGCRLPVQWDELRAYMAELTYHKNFYRWAVGDIMNSWKQIENLIKELEALRKKPKPLSQADKDRLEAIKARIKAYIALIRLRMREIWQSAQRMQGLLVSLQRDYFKPNPPPDVDRLTRKLTSDINDFVRDVGETIKQTELLLRALEAHLDLWNEWAACRRPFPPPKPDSDKIIDGARETPWPTPPGEEIDDLKDKAEEEIGKVPGSVSGKPGIREGRAGGRSAGSRSGRGRGSRQDFVISASFQLSSVSMKSLHSYVDYLNDTWTGDVPDFGWEPGFSVSAGWQFSPNFETGVFYERLGASVQGTLDAVPSTYTSKHHLDTFGLYAAGRTAEILPSLRLVGRAAVGYCGATYAESENGFVTEGRDHAVGGQAAAGLEIALGGGLALDVLGGYRYAVLEGFGASFFMPDSPPVRLEFSGPYAQAGLSFRF